MVLSIAVSKYPSLLTRSDDTLQRTSEFLMSDVGFEPVYIARLPGIAIFSLEVRISPRYYVVKFLEENGLLDQIGATIEFLRLLTRYSWTSSSALTKNLRRNLLKTRPLLAEEKCRLV
jgi:hypothetical protein